jgi:hypothetical protein
VIAKWVIVAWCALGALLVISVVGKPRKPLSPGAAVIAVALQTAEIIAIILWWRT